MSPRRPKPICEWETVVPANVCRKPAVFRTSGKLMCQEHGDAINRRWPGAAKALEVKISKLPSRCFTNANCAQSNQVFLWENCSAAPYIRPVMGWEIVGYGTAPWPGDSQGFAVMLEKTTPAQERANIFAKSDIRFDEGARIWQHLKERIFREIIK